MDLMQGMGRQIVTGERAEAALSAFISRRDTQRRRDEGERATEAPALVHVFDWTTDRLLFSVLVWPSLESSARDADHVFRERVGEVLEIIGKGAAERAWSTYWQVDYGLRWDPRREVWTGSDGFRYDGEGLRAYARGGQVNGAA